MKGEHEKLVRDEAIFLVKKDFFHVKPAVFLYSGEEDQNEGDHHAYAELFEQAFGECIVGVRHRPPETLKSVRDGERPGNGLYRHPLGVL